jgi:hypothetical protein
MTDINISVYHILHFAHIIDRSFQSLEKLLEIGVFDNGKNEEIRHMVQINAFNQILLCTTSLMDEYNDHFKSSNAKTNNEKDKVEQTRELLKPVFKSINKWKGLREFRNNILAHNLRNRKLENNSVFITKGISGYDIPERVRDFDFLIKCIDLIRQVVYKVFKEEYYITVKEINKINDSTKAKIPLSKRDYKKEYKDLQDDVRKIKEKIEARFS